MNYKVTFFALALLLSGGAIIASESALDSGDDDTNEVFRTISFTGGDGHLINRESFTPTPPLVRNLESPGATTTAGDNGDDRDDAICPRWLYQQTVGAALAWLNNMQNAGKKDQ